MDAYNKNFDFSNVLNFEELSRLYALFTLISSNPMLTKLATTSGFFQESRNGIRFQSSVPWSRFPLHVKYYLSSSKYIIQNQNLASCGSSWGWTERKAEGKRGEPRIGSCISFKIPPVSK
jgi:hypothetical protein